MLLNKWLSVFVAETRKQDGDPYSPKSLYLLLSGILQHMRNLNPACPNFLNIDDHQFATFHHTLDNVLRKLRLDGVGVPKQPEVFTKEDEESLWVNEILTVDDPKGLLRVVFSQWNFFLPARRRAQIPPHLSTDTAHRPSSLRIHRERV